MALLVFISQDHFTFTLPSFPISILSQNLPFTHLFLRPSSINNLIFSLVVTVLLTIPPTPHTEREKDGIEELPRPQHIILRELWTADATTSRTHPALGQVLKPSQFPYLLYDRFSISIINKIPISQETSHSASMRQIQNTSIRPRPKRTTSGKTLPVNERKRARLVG